MICPKCEEGGQTSKVYASGFSMRTAMGFASYYDEEGKYHVHDTNCTTEGFNCTNGHKIGIKKYSRCPSCDFNAGKDQMDVV